MPSQENHVAFSVRWITSSFPTTSTNTAKLVRWVLLHLTVVKFPFWAMTSSVVIPAVVQLPLPTLCSTQHCNDSVWCMHSCSLFWKVPVDAAIRLQCAIDCSCKSKIQLNRLVLQWLWIANVLSPWSNLGWKYICSSLSSQLLTSASGDWSNGGIGGREPRWKIAKQEKEHGNNSYNYGGSGIQVIKNCLVNQMDLFVLPSSISSSLSSTSDDGTVMVEMLSLWV